MYKGHSNRAAYLRWCQKEWNKAHPPLGSLLNQTIAAYVQEFCSLGAVGQSDIYEWRTEEQDIARVLVFVHLLPSSPDALADRFSEALAEAVQGGYVPIPSPGGLHTQRKRAPSSNTGLTSPPSAN